MPQKLSQTFGPTKEQSNGNWERSQLTANELGPQISLGEGRFDPTTATPQPTYNKLRPIFPVKEFGLTRDQLEKDTDVSDITTTANVAYSDRDSWGIYPVDDSSSEKQTSMVQANNAFSPSFSKQLDITSYIGLYLTQSQHYPYQPNCSIASECLLV